MKKYSTIKLTLMGIGVGLNIIGAFIALILRIPILLDSIGTILISFLFGPIYGIATGILGSLISGFTYDIYSIYFSPVQILIGGIVGYLASKNSFNGKKIFFSLLILTIPTAFLGAIIANYLFDGVTSSGSSYLVQILTFLGFSKGFTIFLIQFITDYIDKFFTIKLVEVVIKKLPNNIKERFKWIDIAK